MKLTVYLAALRLNKSLTNSERRASLPAVISIIYCVT